MSAHRLLLRADAGFPAGSGHVSRLLALAGAWTARSGRATLLTVNPSTSLRARAAEAATEVVSIAAGHPAAADLSAMRDAIAGEATEPWVAIDGYGFDADYCARIKSAGARVLVVDDGPRLASYQADAFLDQNGGAEAREYPLGPEVLTFLGPKWALLRAGFAAAAAARVQRPDASRLLISFGGADPDDATGRVLKALLRIAPPFETTVVIGPDNPRAETLARSIAGLPVRFETNADMAALMQWADMSVLGGGVTMLEACAAGLPSLIATVAPNQEAGAATLAHRGAVRLLGDASLLTETALAAALIALREDAAGRYALARAGRTTVDGLGAGRVADALRAVSATSLADARLRAAAPEDAYEIWRIANDPAVRQRSFRQEPIALAAHLAWFNARLKDAASRFWVLDVGGVIAAQIRYARSGDGAEVHYSVRGAFRGKGLGTLALASSRELACRELGVKRLTGLVITPNEPSERAFVSAGWARRGSEKRDDQDCAVFEASCS